MSVQALSWVLKHSKSTGTTRCVLIAIANHCDGPEGWAHVRLICEEANCSTKSYHRAVQWAATNGELERVVNAGGSTRIEDARRPNLFAFPKMGDPQTDHPTPPQDVEETPPQDVDPGSRAVLEPSLEPSESTRESFVEEQFDAFWLEYPRKDDKRRARAAWPRALKRAGGVAVLVDAARRYAADPNRVDRFTKQAATWLNADAWLNGPLPARKGDRRMPGDLLEASRDEPARRVIV